MDGQTVGYWLEMIVGFLLIILILLDVFVTILYARIGSGFVSYRLSSFIWRAFRVLSKPAGERRKNILVFCGPVVLVVLVAFWTLTLDFGAALVIHPNLGTGIQIANGATPTTFATALFAAGSSLSIVGSGNFDPQTDFFRLFYLFNSIAGASLIALIITYILQVYNALLRRNAFCLKLYLLTSETNDAADLLGGLGPEGHFEGGYTTLSEMAGEAVHVKESHHFYPVLFYFRFMEPFYSVSQAMVLALDLVTLTKSGLNDERYGWLKKSAAVAQIWSTCIMLLTNLTDNYLSGGMPEPKAPDEATLNRWQRRYSDALERLRQADLKTIADEHAGFEIYVSLRKQWEHLIVALAPTMAYQVDEIDPSSYKPQEAETRPDFRARLHKIRDTR